MRWLPQALMNLKNEERIKTMGKGMYIYGIVKENGKRSFGRGGISAGEEVYTLPYQDISCVVSNSTIQDYSTMLKENLGQHLVKHQATIEKIMKNYTTIPMKFGTEVGCDDEVIEVLKRGYLKFKEQLSNMDGKIEFDLACTWNDLNGIIKTIGEEDEEIKKSKAKIATKPLTSSLQDRIKLGMMIKDALDKKKEKEQAHIIDSLKGLVVDFQKHQLMDDKMILNCAFLLEKSRESDFDVKLKELDNGFKQKVNFRCVGPLPPYSFATCQLRKVNYSQLDEARKLLSLESKVSLREIKESYRELAQKNHPDKDLENSRLNDQFEKTTQAYKLLVGCCQEQDVFFEDKRQNDFIMVEIIRP